MTPEASLTKNTDFITNTIILHQESVPVDYMSVQVPITKSHQL